MDSAKIELKKSTKVPEELASMADWDTDTMILKVRWTIQNFFEPNFRRKTEVGHDNEKYKTTQRFTINFQDVAIMTEH